MIRKKSTLKIITVLLSLSIALTLIASCSADSDTPADTAEKVNDSLTETNTETETTPFDPISTIPETDYQGYEMRFLTLNQGINATTRFTDEIYVEKESGEIINDAVFKRNQLVEERLNIKIVAIPTAGIYQAARSAIMAGDNAFDMIGAYKSESINLASERLVRNWYEIPVLDFDQPWWNQNARNAFTLADTLYLMSGSILISEIDDTLALTYNKSLGDEYGCGDIYALVKNQTWTIDRFAEMVVKISRDLNGDGEIKKGDDLFGYIQDPASMTNNWCFSTDLLKGNLSESGEYTIEVDVGRVQTVLEKLATVFTTESALSNLDLYEGLTYFEENKIFMYAIILRNIELLREMEFDFGIIPYPKFDETQSDYLTHVGGASPILTIPITNADDDDRLGIILEAMAAASLSLVRPAYYETALKEKYSRDPESTEMLDIIVKSSTYDLGYFAGFGITGSVADQIKKGTTNFTSAWERMEKSSNTNAQKLIDKLLA